MLHTHTPRLSRTQNKTTKATYILYNIQHKPLVPPASTSQDYLRRRVVTFPPPRPYVVVIMAAMIMAYRNSSVCRPTMLIAVGLSQEVLTTNHPWRCSGTRTNRVTCN